MCIRDRSPYWDPRKPVLRCFFFIFFKNGLSRHNPRKGPTNVRGKSRSTGAWNFMFAAKKARKRHFRNLNQVVCGFTAARQGSSHKREILHAVLRSYTLKLSTDVLWATTHFRFRGVRIEGICPKKLGPPKNGEKTQKVETPQSFDFA